jgi:thiamine kinase-like enzyme
MDIVNLKAICEIYCLGIPILPPKKISGGFIHKMWKLETKKGNFAVKELNAEIMLRPNLVQNMNQCESIANKLKEKGIGTVCGIAKDGNYVFNYNSSQYIVYPWIEGVVFDLDNEISLDNVKKISLTMAKIHNSKLEPNLSDENQINLVDYSVWLKLKNDIIKSNDEYLKLNCTSFIDNMGKWFELVNISNIKLQKQRVVSHRDLDMKNVIWDNKNNPLIIDWESAGSINPFIDLVRVALDWSGEAKGKANKKLFIEIFKTYSEVNALDKDNVKDAFYSSIWDNLGWLEFNIKKALRIYNMDTNDSEIAYSEISKTIDIINSRMKHMNEYISWI